MVNFSTLSTLFLSLFISNGELSDVSKTESNPVEVAVSQESKGILIDDFSDEMKIFNWWDGNPENFERKWDQENEVLVVKLKNVGKDYDTFGKQFDPIDFTETPALKVRMKYEGETAPKVRIDVKDYDGKVANGNPIVKTLKSGDYQDYYYNFTGKFVQSWPDKDEVDAVEIVELLVFVNPGGPDYSGTLYLDSIEAIPASECK